VAQDTTADALFAECLALGKAPIAFGKSFTECRTWQRALDKEPVNKGFFAECYISGTRQQKKPAVNSSLTSATSAALGKEFFLF
jgi:hypothetical protein